MNKFFIFFCIEEIAIIALFVFLAIHFDHWWIALFSLLFMYTTFDNKEKGNHDNEAKKGEQNDSLHK